MTEKYLARQIEAAVPSPKDLSAASEAFYNLDFAQGLVQIWEAIAWANKLIDDAKPWELVKTEPQKVKVLLTSLAALLLEIALKLSPVMPEAANTIRTVLENEEIKKAEPLFAKID